MQNLHPDDQNILRCKTKRVVLREALGGRGGGAAEQHPDNAESDADREWDIAEPWSRRVNQQKTFWPRKRKIYIGKRTEPDSSESGRLA